jgi:hypothetical protein
LARGRRCRLIVRRGGGRPPPAGARVRRGGR